MKVRVASRCEIRRTVNPYTGLPALEISRSRTVEVDPCVVETAPLAAALSAYVDGYRKGRPSTAGRFRGEESSTDVDPLTPYASLAFETGLPEQEIRRIVNPRKHPYVELRVADALLAAGVGDPMLMYLPPDRGGLRVLPNEKHPDPGSGCCGGSTA